MSVVYDRADLQVCHPESEAWPPTALERANLRISGFYDLDDPYPEYGQKSLVCAYRAGYHDAPTPAAELRRTATALRRESNAVSQLDARGLLLAAKLLDERAEELESQGGKR